MELKSMKLSDADRKAEKPATALGEMPAYPYGLQIHLEESAIKKLQLAGLPAVGQKIMLHASVEVTAISERESKDGGKHRSLSLQITDMALAPAAERKSDAEVIYGG